ncbi:MAG: hypothetical protein GX446_02985 [Chthonomonadales bacterium]|nr:hypothetical protein [Chthonomonadales bacterium]
MVDPASEIDALNLPEQDRSALKEIIASGPRSERHLDEMLSAVQTTRHEPMRAGLCWYLGVADLGPAYQARAKEVLTRVIGSYTRRGPLSAGQIRLMLLLAAWLLLNAFVGVQPAGSILCAALLCASAAMGVVWLLKRSKERHPRPDGERAAIQALRSLHRITGKPPLGEAMALALLGHEWLRKEALAEYESLCAAAAHDGRTDPLMTVAIARLALHSDPLIARSTFRALGGIAPHYAIAAIRDIAEAALVQADGWSLTERGLLQTEAAEAVARIERRFDGHEAGTNVQPVCGPSGQEDTDDSASRAYLDHLAWDVRRIRKGRRAVFGVAGSCFAFAAVGLPIAVVLPGDMTNFAVGCVLAMLLGMVFVVVGMLIQPASRSPIWKAGWHGNRNEIGPLLEATKLLMPNVLQRVAPALYEGLPCLRDTDRDLLTPYQRQCLVDALVGEWLVNRSRRRSALRRLVDAVGVPLGTLCRIPGALFGAYATYRDDLMRTAILHALMAIGDDADAPAVRLVVQRTHNRRQHPIVHAAAVECLRMLDERQPSAPDTNQIG